MTFDVNVYDNALVDLVAGSFNASTNLNALLLNSTYTFSKTDANVSAVSAQEATGSGYARFTTTANFTVAQVGDEIQYQVISPAITFSAFSGNWQYIVIYNASSNKLYLCVDSGANNNQAGGSFTLDPGTDPFIRVLAP